MTIALGVVVNVRDYGRPAVRRGALVAAGVVYVGRAVPAWGLERSVYANPYRVAPGPRALEQELRAAVLGRYREWLASQPGLVDRARDELAGRRLACWCAPLPCHADILARVAAGGAP